jgi:hypothetical protein
VLVGLEGEEVGGGEGEGAYLEVVEPVCFHFGGLVGWV